MNVMDMMNESGKLSTNRVKVIKMMEFNIYDPKNLAHKPIILGWGQHV